MVKPWKSKCNVHCFLLIKYHYDMKSKLNLLKNIYFPRLQIKWENVWIDSHKMWVIVTYPLFFNFAILLKKQFMFAKYI